MMQVVMTVCRIKVKLCNLNECLKKLDTFSMWQNVFGEVRIHKCQNVYKVLEGNFCEGFGILKNDYEPLVSINFTFLIRMSSIDSR